MSVGVGAPLIVMVLQEIGGKFCCLGPCRISGVVGNEKCLDWNGSLWRKLLLGGGLLFL